MRDEDKLLLKRGAAELGVDLTANQLELFSVYLEELKSWGKRMNLFRRADDQEIIVKDLLDSLAFLQHLPAGASLADCGSGAGFPGVPVKIVRPDLRVCLLDTAQKKVFFLKNLLRSLGLAGIEAVWAGKGGRPGGPGDFDIVVTRAFGSLGKICVSCGSLVKRGGILLAMKGKKGVVELTESLPALEAEGWKLAFTEISVLPFLGHERTLIALLKKNVPRET